jgi:hypothetical protein
MMALLKAAAGAATAVARSGGEPGAEEENASGSSRKSIGASMSALNALRSSLELVFWRQPPDTEGGFMLAFAPGVRFGITFREAARAMAPELGSSSSSRAAAAAAAAVAAAAAAATAAAAAAAVAAAVTMAPTLT